MVKSAIRTYRITMASGKMNENGQRPPTVMSLSQIVCEKYLFRERGLSQSILKVSKLNLVRIRPDSLNSVCNTRDYHKANCDPKNSLIPWKVKLKPKNYRNATFSYVLALPTYPKNSSAPESNTGSQTRRAWT